MARHFRTVTRPWGRVKPALRESPWPLLRCLCSHAASAHSDDGVAFSVCNTADPGDFNADGSIDAADIDALTVEVKAETHTASFDLTGDGLVDMGDRTQWVEEIKNTFFGDADLDGKVDASDLNILGINWQITTATSWAQGDFNGDGSVLAGDLNALGMNWQKGVAAAVPEPSSLVLALGLSMFFGFTTRQRQNPSY